LKKLLGIDKFGFGTNRKVDQNRLNSNRNFDTFQSKKIKISIKFGRSRNWTKSQLLVFSILTGKTEPIRSDKTQGVQICSDKIFKVQLCHTNIYRDNSNSNFFQNPGFLSGSIPPMVLIDFRGPNLSINSIQSQSVGGVQIFDKFDRFIDSLVQVRVSTTRVIFPARVYFVET
jgi:hypothetical protein